MGSARSTSTIRPRSAPRSQIRARYRDSNRRGIDPRREPERLDPGSGDQSALANGEIDYRASRPAAPILTYAAKWIARAQITEERRDPRRSSASWQIGSAVALSAYRASASKATAGSICALDPSAPAVLEVNPTPIFLRRRLAWPRREASTMSSSSLESSTKRAELSLRRSRKHPHRSWRSSAHRSVRRRRVEWAMELLDHGLFERSQGYQFWSRSRRDRDRLQLLGDTPLTDAVL